MKNISHTRKTAYWKDNGFFLICSNCDYCRDTKDNEGNDIPDNFCSNCGYKMIDRKYISHEKEK